MLALRADDAGCEIFHSLAWLAVEPVAIHFTVFAFLIDHMAVAVASGESDEDVSGGGSRRNAGRDSSCSIRRRSFVIFQFCNTILQFLKLLNLDCDLEDCAGRRNTARATCPLVC